MYRTVRATYVYRSYLHLKPKKDLLSSMHCVENLLFCTFFFIYSGESTDCRRDELTSGLDISIVSNVVLPNMCLEFPGNFDEFLETFEFLFEYLSELGIFMIEFRKLTGASTVYLLRVKMSFARTVPSRSPD